MMIAQGTEKSTYIYQAVVNPKGNITAMTEAEFLETMNKKGVMTLEEEKAAFLYYRANPTKENRNLIALKNDRLIWKSARQYATTGIPEEDLHMEGFIGILKAIERFDPEREAKFSTYATYWINQGMLRFMENNGRPIRMPSHMIVTYAQILRFQKKYSAESGCNPTIQEISTSTGIPEREVKRVLDAATSTFTTSLNSPVTSEDGDQDSEVQDFIADNSVSPEDEAVSSVSGKAIAKFVKSRLTDREWYVVARRFGFEGERRRTLEELGEDMGITRERVRQIEMKAIRKLQLPSAKSILKTFL